MTQADVLKFFLIIVGILSIYVSYWLVSHALFPNVVENARAQYGKPIRITLLGAVVGIIPFIAGGAISKLPNPAVKLVGVSLMAIPVLLGLVGSAGLVLRIGSGLQSPLDAQQPWRRVLRGGILFSLTFLLPFVGWFVIPIWAHVSGLGAFVLAVFNTRSARNPQPPVMNLSPA